MSLELLWFARIIVCWKYIKNAEVGVCEFKREIGMLWRTEDRRLEGNGKKWPEAAGEKAVILYIKYLQYCPEA